MSVWRSPFFSMLREELRAAVVCELTGEDIFLEAMGAEEQQQIQQMQEEMRRRDRVLGRVALEDIQKRLGIA